MKWPLALSGLLLLVPFAWPQAAHPPAGAVVVIQGEQPPDKDKPKPKPPDPKDKPTPLTLADPSAVPQSLVDPSTLYARRLAPEMLGDQPPVGIRFPIITFVPPNTGGTPPGTTVPGGTTPTTPGGTTPTTPGGGTPTTPTTPTPPTVTTAPTPVLAPVGIATAIAPAVGVAATTPSTVVTLPGPRGYKVSDNGSPRPQDRFYFSFNFFSDLNASANRNSGLSNVNGYREAIGLEKTFLQGWCSLDLRLPLQTLTADSTNPSLGRTNTAVGDLSIALRAALYRDDDADNWVTAGLAVTPPTGSDTFGGVPNVTVLHSTTLQPFVAALWHTGNCYVQGFTSLDIPTDTRDVTLWYNDIGVGYFLYHNPDRSRFLTAVVPVLEAHITTPLDGRGAFGASDVVNLTAGVNVGFFGKSSLGLGVMTPVTGPRPFEVEATLQFRCRF